MNAQRKKLTLTFDNGPDPAVTPQVLAELEKRGLPAIFFPVGERLEDASSPGLIRQVHEAGHRIGNHTYSHPRPFGSLPADAAIAEIQRTDALLGDVIEPDRLFRPSAGGGVFKPGVLNQGIVDYLIESRHTLVLWNVICEDWSRPDGSWVEIALERMAGEAWSLIVLHDIASGAMDHLPRFLDAVAAAGVEVVPRMPDNCVPIVRGRLVHSVSHLI